MTENHTPLRVTDAGLETVMVFEHGFDLPEFAAFPLLDVEQGRTALLDYYEGFVRIAAASGVDLVLDTPTWRASSNWGDVLGYDAEDLHRFNTAGVGLLDSVRRAQPTDGPTISISGSVGPAADGYTADVRMTADEAAAYHRPQIASFAEAGADVVSAVTMTYIDEAVGVARAAADVGLPVVISFTVETDGNLPSGETLEAAITAVDTATDGSVSFFGINCAHPDHFGHRLDADGAWTSRIGLIRANASRMSHEELDNAPELDPGDPVELGGQLAELRDRFPHLSTLGGCCGTSHDHIEQIARSASTVGAVA